MPSLILLSGCTRAAVPYALGQHTLPPSFHLLARSESPQPASVPPHEPGGMQAGACPHGSYSHALLAELAGDTLVKGKGGGGGAQAQPCKRCNRLSVCVRSLTGARQLQHLLGDPVCLIDPAM